MAHPGASPAFAAGKPGSATQGRGANARDDGRRRLETVEQIPDFAGVAGSSVSDGLDLASG